MRWSYKMWLFELVVRVANRVWLPQWLFGLWLKIKAGERLLAGKRQISAPPFVRYLIQYANMKRASYTDKINQQWERIMQNFVNWQSKKKVCVVYWGKRHSADGSDGTDERLSSIVCVTKCGGGGWLRRYTWYDGRVLNEQVEEEDEFRVFVPQRSELIEW